MSIYGKHIQDVADAVRSGPFSEMRSAGRLTPADLRRGASRMEADARFRRYLADHLEAEGRDHITVHEAAELRADHGE